MQNKESVEVQNKKRKNERGASLVEYALLVALVAVATITAMNTLGSKAVGTLNKASSQLPQ
jgi:pilus assembly protein Flp/PilA